MKKFLSVIALLIATFSISYSQDDKDGKVYLTFLNSNILGQDFQGGGLGGDYDFFKQGNFRVGATGEISLFPTKSGPDSFWYSGGPRVSYKVGKVEPFGRVQVGGVRYAGFDAFTKSVGGGVDLNFGSFFVGGQFDRQWVEGLPFVSLNRLGGRGGFRF